MRITVNGEVRELEGEMSIAAFLRSQGANESFAIVEHNLRTTAREEWPTLTLKNNDRLEVIQMLGGG